MTIPVEPACFASHLGPWACEPSRFAEAVAAVKAGIWGRRAEKPSIAARVEAPAGAPRPTSGVAVIRLTGILTKAPSKFDDTTSTAMARRAVRAAAEDGNVQAILLLVDSPGGYVEGTDDLARDVAAAALRKPVEAYVEDLCASAAYWVAAQAQKVWSNPTGFIGSIGVYQVVYDSSKAMEMEGIQVHVVSTGPVKGGGAPGVPITDEVLAAVQTWVDDTNDHFLGAVRKGRGMTPKAVKELATGDIWIASKAKENGLIDGIKSLDDVMAALAEKGRKWAAKAQPKSAAAGLALELEREP